MKTVQIDLPDALAEEAAGAGLLAPAAIERMLRRMLRADRVSRLADVLQDLHAAPPGPMSDAEIAAEIAAYRSERRRAAGP